jgi:1-acyl-sn-glycerol-3-phosphate acyltransferase
MAEPVYRPVIRTALTLFRALDFRFDVRGVEHLPLDGPAVLAANHVSYFDFMFVGYAAHLRNRRFVRFLAKKSVFTNPISGPLMRGMHHIPVDRAAGAAAYAAGLDALAQGELVGVFPESTISRSFLPRTFKSGAARLALDSGAPLLPVVSWGGHRVWTSGRRPQLRRHVPVALWVDAPLVPRPSESPAELTARLADRMLALVEEAVAGYPRPAAAPGGDWWLPSTAGGSAPTPEQAARAEQRAIEGRRSA